MFAYLLVALDFGFCSPAPIISKIFYYHNTLQNLKCVSIYSTGRQHSLNFYLISELLFTSGGSGGGARSVYFGNPAFQMRRDQVVGGVLAKQLIK